jgi:hypothetical protein
MHDSGFYNSSESNENDPPGEESEADPQGSRDPHDSEFVDPASEDTDSGDSWPETLSSQFQELIERGDAGRRVLAGRLMELYKDSLIRLYIRVSKPGDGRLPRVPMRQERATLDEQAQEVVHEYFSKRAKDLIPKWQKYKTENPNGRALRLRVFIRQDFRWHCHEMLRRETRYINRALELEEENYDSQSDWLDGVIHELDRIDDEAELKLAIELTLQSYGADQSYMRTLVEGRLAGREYETLCQQLGGSKDMARQRWFRFLQKLRDSFRHMRGDLGDA